jgi:lipopolysaccharide export system protein LptA
MRRAATWLLLLGLFGDPGFPVASSVLEAGTHERGRAPKARAKPAQPDREDPRAGADRKSQPVTIDADQMESLKKEGLVIFTGNVIARQNHSVHYADRMEVYLDEKDEKVHRIISTGNVKIITKDCRTGTAGRAEYYEDEQKVLLIGNARVWQEDNIVTGERITMFLAEDRSVVQSGPQRRVQAIFYPKTEDQKKKAGQAKEDGRGAKGSTPPCG